MVSKRSYDSGRSEAHRTISRKVGTRLPINKYLFGLEATFSRCIFLERVCV